MVPILPYFIRLLTRDDALIALMPHSDALDRITQVKPKHPCVHILDVDPFLFTLPFKS